MQKVKWNTELKGDNAIIYEDGLTIKIQSTISNAVISNLGKTKGKYYCEIEIANNSSSPGFIGICTKNFNVKSKYSQICSWNYYGNDGRKWNNGESFKYGQAYSAGDIIGIALDLVNHNIGFYKNGNFQGIAFENIPKEEMFICITYGSSSSSFIATANFGYKSFKYPVPTGYKPYQQNDKYLLKKNNQYYTIKEKFYEVINNKYVPCIKDFQKNGFDDLSELTDKIGAVTIEGTKEDLRDCSILKFPLSNEIVF